MICYHVFVLGSVNSHDWVTAAEKLGAFDNLDIYKEFKSKLESKNFTELYEIADDLTSELQIGYLLPAFYKKSNFNESGKRCRNHLDGFCDNVHVQRVMICSNTKINLKNFLTVNENAMKVKYRQVCSSDEENGFLFIEGPHDSG